MNAKVSSFILIGLSVLGWVLTVVALAEPTALWKTTENDVDIGLGFFKWKAAGTVYSYAKSKSMIGGEGLYGCSDMESMFNAFRAFGVMACIFIGVAMVVHVVQAFAANIIPSAITPYIKYIHLVSAVCCLLTWVLIAPAFAADICEDAYSDAADINFGIFFFVGVMVTEIVCFVVCSTAATGAKEGSLLRS